MHFGIRTFSIVLVGAGAVVAQVAVPSSQPERTSPIYRVTVISETTKAVNYGHRTDPTRIDFRGTVLLPDAGGSAVVESRRGSVTVDAKFEHVPSPQRFGPQYLTYVMWAITPDGKAQNLGELVLNSSDKGKLRVATPLQSFALLVTAEPYYSVDHPSGVVVMENHIRPDTVGKIEEMEARYDLLPVKPYTYHMNAAKAQAAAGGPKMSMDRYEATLALYEAQNAVQIARAELAAEYAPDTMEKAEQLYRQAQTYYSQKADSKLIVSTAREAVQTAEDARLVARKHNPDRAEQASLPQGSR
ncbi:MAG: hypothetical protein ACRD9L_23640 [Bryobacteraceae bacterium]